MLHLVNSSNNTIQGNYLHHDYHGGFSQGFNIWLEGSSDNELIEHNVIRGGSWPVQSVGGEFRYNLVIDSGHTFWRSARNNVRIHHNVFANASGPNTGYDAGIYTFSGESGLRIYNNTFDMGGTIGGFDAPGIRIGAGSVFTSIRNNLFTQFVNISSQYGRAVISAPEGQVSSARVTSADYNAFYSPNGTANIRYLPNIVSNPPGDHDMQANPQLAGAVASEVPYRISEGCLWLKDCTTGQVLSHYREVYRPTASSPLINAGDPADGVGTAIGAVGPDDTNPADLFGRGLAVTPPGPDTQPPVGSIAINDGAPATANAAVQLTLSAFDASGVTMMRLANDGGAFGAHESYVTSRPWTLNTSGADGPRTVSVQYQDGADNWSGAFTAAITLDRTAPTIAISAPVGGGTVSGSVTIAATASDNIALARVRFLVDQMQIGERRSRTVLTRVGHGRPRRTARMRSPRLRVTTPGIRRRRPPSP